MIYATTPAHFLQMMEEFDGRHDVVEAITPPPFMSKPPIYKEVVIQWHSPTSVSCGGSDGE